MQVHVRMSTATSDSNIQCCYWQLPTAYLTAVRQHVPSNRVFLTSQSLSGYNLHKTLVCLHFKFTSYITPHLLLTILDPDVQLMKICGSQHLEKQTVSLSGCVPILLIFINLQSSHIHTPLHTYIHTYAYSTT